MSPPIPEPVGSPVDEYLAHAKFHARLSASGLGAATARSGYEDGERFWDCVVVDGREWCYIRVLGRDLGPFESVPTEDIEAAIDRFAATLPPKYRLRALLNTNPLHVSRSGEVHD
jgi:hypothetical protein